MQPYRNILVALACTEQDHALLEYVAMLRTSVVHLAHILDPQNVTADEQQVERHLHAAATKARIFGTIKCSVRRGDRLDGLLQIALAQKCDLLMLGHRRSRSGRRSLARRLAMSAPCSVWLVPEGCPARLNRILVPVDFSDRSADALHTATAVGSSAGSDECYALHVRFNPAVTAFEDYADIEMADEQQAFMLFVAPIDLHGMDVIPIFEQGANVAVTIRRIAEERSCDLIVMGTRGRSRAASVLLGSETEQTIIESRLAVLAVKHYGARLRLIQALFRERSRKGGDLRFG